MQRATRFDAHFWNKKFAQLIFDYAVIIDDIHLCEDIG